MNFDFGEVLTRAWKITWKYKVLWIFGVLASCGRGSSNSSNNSRSSGDTGEIFTNEVLRDAEIFLRDAGQWIEQNMWALYAMIAFLVILWLIQITLANIGQIGLMRGAYHADLDVPEIRFGGLWGESLAYFWRVIGLSLAVWGPILLFFICLLSVFVISAAGTGGMNEEAALGAVMLFAVAFCCCVLPLMAVLGLYYAQAARAMTLEDLGVLDALKRGWVIFSENFLGLALMGFILFIVNLILGILIAIPVYIAVIPLVLQFISGAVDTWTPVLVTLGVLCAYSPIAWLLNGILVTYTQNVWTVIYIRVSDLKNKARDNQPLVIEVHA